MTTIVGHFRFLNPYLTQAEAQVALGGFRADTGPLVLASIRDQYFFISQRDVTEMQRQLNGMTHRAVIEEADKARDSSAEPRE